MNTHLLSLAAPGLALALAGVALEARYPAETGLRVTRETSFSMETTSMEMEVDGEPVDRGGFGGGSSETSRRVVWVDRVLAAEDGHPTEVRRTFETLSGDTTRFDQEVALSSPLDGVVLLLSLEDGEVVVRVEEGEQPDDETMLEGHRLAPSLDLLLPDGEVEPGATWDVDGETLLGTLQLDLDAHLFERPEFDFGDFGGRRRGGDRAVQDGRGRGRGGRGGRMGPERLLAQADWTATARLVEGTEERDGVECHVIAIEASASGELEDVGGFGGPGGRRGERLTGAPGAAAVGTDLSVELEGKLYFSTELARAVAFEVEGTLTVESQNEFTRGESTMSMSRAQEGTFSQTVAIATAETE